MAEENPERTIEVHYIKSNSFRVVHADGAWGGITRRGNVAMALYSERNPIPQRIVEEISPDGTTAKEQTRVAKGGVIREVEVEVILDLETARGLVQWLGDKVQVLDGLLSQTTDQTEK